MPERATPQIDEHVVRVQRSVLAVEVVGIQPHQLGAGRNHPGPARLGPHPVVVDPRHDRDLSLGDPEVLVAQPERLPDPQPMSSNTANSNRSRSRVHASKIACVWGAVRTRGVDVGAASATVRRRCGPLFVT